MKPTAAFLLIISLLALLALLPVQAQDASSATLIIAGYTVIEPTYAKILPLFQQHWQEQSGQDVSFQESYLASGAQGRAVEGGFEADVVALSLEGDVQRVVDAGLITHDWKDNLYGGMISTSEVILVVRKDNPKNIQDWRDLAQPGIEVITPDAASSGGAQWNVMGAYGAAFRGHVEGFPEGADGARQFIAALFSNVSVMDTSGLESYLTFERGIGDVSITYENQYYAGIVHGDDFTIVYPSSTILIENPLALVDAYVDKHGTREVTEAFIEFLYRPEIQSIFQEDGFRPPVPKQLEAAAGEATAEPEATAVFWPEGSLDLSRFPLIADQFTIADFGGWEQVKADIFSEEGVYTQVIAEVKGG